MKSERMKTSGMGRGAGGKESEIVLGFMGGGVFFWRARWKNSVLFGCFCLPPGKKTTKTGEK